MMDERLEFDVLATIRRVSRAKVVSITIDGDDMALAQYTNGKQTGAAKIVDYKNLSIKDIKADVEEFRKS